MKLKYTFTPKEKKLLLAFKGGKSLSAEDNFGGWRSTPEFEALRNNKLIYHYNQRSDGDYIRYRLTDKGEQVLASMIRPRVRSVKQIAVISGPGGRSFPLDRRTVIVLDKDNVNEKKEHQIAFQHGRTFGSVGDYCHSFTHDDLFKMEEAGMIIINPK